VKQVKFAAILVTSAALVIACISPSSAQPLLPPPVQDPWLSSLAALEKSVEMRPGFSQIVINSPGDVTVQFEEGTSTAELKLAHFPSLNVKIATTAFSLQELTDERDRITDEVKRSKAKVVRQIGPLPDLSGVLIEVGPDPATGEGKGLPTPADLGVTVNDIPVSVRISEGDASPVAYTRFDSGGASGNALHFGGQRIKSGSTNCTSGVPVYDQGSGKSSVLTAGHCGGLGSYWTDNMGYGYGAMYRNLSSQFTASYDYALIENPSSAINIGSIFRGRTYDIGTSRMAPQRVNAGLGMQLCASGSYSGEVCELGVVSVNQNVYYAAIDTWYNNLTRLTSFGTYAGWGVGDSGGPVFYPNSDGSASIAGISSGQLTATPMPCREATYRTCYKDLYMAPFSYVQDTQSLIISQGM
jgi:hypothetical protein